MTTLAAILTLPPLVLLPMPVLAHVTGHRHRA